MTHDTAGPDRLDDPGLAGLSFTRRGWVAAPPARLYDLVSDVSRIGEWSPNASQGSYEDGGGPWPGARFSGINRKAGREWTTWSEVLEADPGRRFSFVVGGVSDGIVRWSWTFTEHGPGTVVEQAWQVLRLDPVLGATRADVEALRDYMAASAETTLITLAAWIAQN